MYSWCFSPICKRYAECFRMWKKFTVFLPGLWPGFCGDLSSGQPHAEHLCGSWASGVRSGLYHIIMSNLLVSKGSSDLWIFSICQVRKALTMVEGSCIACLHLPTKSMYLVNLYTFSWPKCLKNGEFCLSSRVSASLKPRFWWESLFAAQWHWLATCLGVVMATGSSSVETQISDLPEVGFMRHLAALSVGALLLLVITVGWFLSHWPLGRKCWERWWPGGWLTIVIVWGNNGVDESVTTENFLFGPGHGS